MHGDLRQRRREATPKALWNGEFYVQEYDPSDGARATSSAPGCLSDQLLGQWFCDVVDLGYVLPEEHVKTRWSRSSSTTGAPTSPTTTTSSAPTR